MIARDSNVIKYDVEILKQEKTRRPFNVLVYSPKQKLF